MKKKKKKKNSQKKGYVVKTIRVAMVRRTITEQFYN